MNSRPSHWKCWDWKHIPCSGILWHFTIKEELKPHVRNARWRKEEKAQLSRGNILPVWCSFPFLYQKNPSNQFSFSIFCVWVHKLRNVLCRKWCLGWSTTSALCSLSGTAGDGLILVLSIEGSENTQWRASHEKELKINLTHLLSRYSCTRTIARSKQKKNLLMEICISQKKPH